MDWRTTGTCLSLALGLSAGWCAWPYMQTAKADPAPATAAAPAAGVDQNARYQKEIEPLLVNYCYDCHGDGSHKGELALDAFKDIAGMQKNREVWKRVREHIGLKLMPPPDEDQPGDAVRKQLVAWIDDAVFPVDPAHPDPGRILLRRLNREEYRNTIHDLLDVDVDVEEILPPDDSGYGFDNIGDVLTLSPVHIERYLTAARQALDGAVHIGEMPFPQKKIEGETMEGPGQRSKEGQYLVTTGEAVANPDLKPGRYQIRITAAGNYGANEAAKMEFRLDGNLLQTWDVPNPLDSPGKFTREITIDQPGKHRIGLNFPNDFYDKDFPDPSRRDRNLMINRLVIEGPLDGPRQQKPASHRRIYGESRTNPDDRGYALEVLNRFARLAFRRPVKPGEVERYLIFLDVAKSQDQDVEQGIRLAMEAMLVSPSFLFREEAVAPAGSPGAIQSVDEHTLATRLSYFLWSSMPDTRLLDLADAGQLRANLGAEISRMLDSEKSKRFISNFGGQWLQLRNLDAITPDDKRFPAFNRALSKDMRRETDMLLGEVLHENLPIRTLLDADYSFINENLARYYGIANVNGKEFRKVSLEGTPRRGILGQGAVLTITSYPTRTSPVLRGKYVLENLLDIAPPPPPPNVPQLGGGHGQDKSLREQMEIHRKDPACSTCHALMDPIGFGLEKFDAVGAYRDNDKGKPIDTSGKLADGAAFANADELRNLLVTQHSAEFERAVATKLLTYALGRGLEWYDRPAIDAVVTKAAANEGRLQTFVRAVIDSVPFQYRRASNQS